LNATAIGQQRRRRRRRRRSSRRRRFEVKVKVKLFLYLIQHHATEMYRGLEVDSYILNFSSRLR
jgi:hypothetical protein